ncbi:MAG TPA: TRAP transporter substrate-binding protein DctP, partial [Dongiaceae bacterium]|nr:TRAP transporter substrate-binding protein DctP [Dongiaceae bacterium]
VDSGLAPLVGAIVMTKPTWAKISEADRTVVMQACQRAETRLKAIVPQQEKDAVAQMQQRGLQVTHVRPDALPEWRSLTEKFATKMRGAIVPPEVLDLAVHERDAYRAQKKP